MARPTYYANHPPPLEPKFYNLNKEEIEFFQGFTGIKDEDELKFHILAVQAKAYKIYGYPCIRSFSFTRLKIAKVPGYKNALSLLNQRENPIFLDVGCCFGNDVRKIVLDGWPVENVIASDLNPGFWDCGHELFKTTPQIFPAAFVAGNIFDSAHLAPCDSASLIAMRDSTSDSASTLPLRDLQSLNPLNRKVSAIFAGAFFHLFNEENQLEVALRLASLLSPAKGSIIFGQHGGLPEKGFRHEPIRNPPGSNAPLPPRSVRMFCHSPETWKELWIKQVFGGLDDKGAERIKVDVELVEKERKDLIDGIPGAEGKRFYLLNWCITRL